MDDLYRDYILEHYRRPHNFGVLDNATATQEGANPLCGDRITLQLRVSDGQIAGVGFTGRGCAISQASASLLTDEIKGKALDRAQSMSSSDVLDMLGIDISPARMKCALLSLETLQGALGGGTGSKTTAAPAAAPVEAGPAPSAEGQA
jgi:nitrogen fixation NifU-like protein